MHGAWQEGRLPLGCHACARSSDGMAMAHGDMLCGRMGQWLGVSATRTQGCPTQELAPLVPAASAPMTGF